MAQESKSYSEEQLVEPDQDKILIIGGDAHEKLYEAYINNTFNVITVKSFTEAEGLVNKTRFPIVIVDENDLISKKESGSNFILTSGLISQSGLIILTAIGFTKIPKQEKLEKSGIRIVKSKQELEFALESIVDGNYPQFNSENFDKAHKNVPTPNFSKENSQRFESSFDKGISPHIASDRWTTEDALGYEDYAYAIYRFMTHKKTKPPLTISIQAPWGGGKTSLMRMVRKFIDPKADFHLKEAAEKPNGELTLEEALAEIKQWIQEKANRKPFNDKDIKQLENYDATDNNLTIWFNAWKYENTNQVWAGLIDSIMQQVAARLPVKERELFWLRLNLKRVDTDKIRSEIHRRIFKYFQRGILFWLIGLFAVWFPAVLIALGTNLKLLFFSFTPTTGYSLSVIGTLILTIGKYLYASFKVKNEPAVVSLSDYLEIPNYSKEIGFIHQAESDLRNVLESIPDKYKPLVIFIDDLDRCSPTKISQVVEAVNLFLAGDFPHCQFVIGMDTEMAAAALQSAHKDMIANLPSDLGIPIGWRFMDKFVQLPFLIPPPRRYTKTYIDSLFKSDVESNEKISKESLQKMSSIIEKKINQNIHPNLFEKEIKSLFNKDKISSTEKAHFQRNLETRVKQSIIDKGIQSFTDRESNIRKLLDKLKAFDYFTGNPRELKRFVNAFRFNYFLLWAQRSQNIEDINEEQLIRWTILSMKWAEVVRWLRRRDGSDLETTYPNDPTIEPKVDPIARLKLLEQTAIESNTFLDWQENLGNRFMLEIKTTNWLNDEDLFQFFRRESKEEEGERLSDGIGKGIW